MYPTTHYAKSGQVHIAYQEFGDGPVNLVFVPGFISHIENYWDEPRCARFFDGLGRFARVVLFDKRGTGLSGRVTELGGMDHRMDDARAVMDAVGIERAAIMGISEGGSLASLFAAHHPDRSEALVLYGAFAKFSSWFPTDQALQDLFEYIENDWGSGDSLPMFAPSMANDAIAKQWWGKFERLGADPGAAIEIMRMNSQIDISDILTSINVPTLLIHRSEDVVIDFEASQYMAKYIPNSRLVALSGADHPPWLGDNTDDIVQAIGEFLTGTKSNPAIDTVLATVMFSDIVDSTKKVENLGDKGWLDLLDAHNKVVRSELGRFRGCEIKSTGDGFLMTFDGPARAIHCAKSISQGLEELGLRVRTGIHIGEVDIGGDDVHGIAVHVASRVADLASADEILISRTVRDLVAGSGLKFVLRGKYPLKGLQEPMEVYGVV